MFANFISEFKAEVQSLASTKLGWFLAGVFAAGGYSTSTLDAVKGFLGL